jgi:hypothetical protein
MNMGLAEVKLTIIFMFECEILFKAVLGGTWTVACSYHYRPCFELFRDSVFFFLRDSAFCFQSKFDILISLENSMTQTYKKRFITTGWLLET